MLFAKRQVAFRLLPWQFRSVPAGDRQSIPVACNKFQVIIGQLGPLLPRSSLHLLPLTFDLVPIHRVTSTGLAAIKRPNRNALQSDVTLTLQITPKEVKQRLDAGEKLRLVDVREPFEYRQARIEGSELIPMRTVSKSLDSLETEEAPVIVFCHHGMRSLQVVSWLREQGVDHCSSMAGGIDRWSLEIDATVPRYV